jgi:dihydroorotase
MTFFDGAPVPTTPHPGGDDLFIRNVLLWGTEDSAPPESPKSQKDRPVDISIRSGRIDGIAPSGMLKPEGRRVVEGGGRSAIPGLVDVHVHFRDPGLTYKEGWVRGSRGAVHGGVTSIVEVQNCPPLSTSTQAIEERLAYVESRSLVDFGCLGNLLADSVPELEGIAPRVPAIKLFLGCSTGVGGQDDPDEIRALFEAAARAGRMVVAHCEDQALLNAGEAAYPNATAMVHHLVRSAEAEVVSIRLAIDCLRETGGALHVFHITSAGGVQLVRDAKAEGLAVFATTAPHYLLLSCEDAERLDCFIKVNPSVKTKADGAAILAGLKDGTVDGIGTDHAPHPIEHKTRVYGKAPSGMPSIDLLWPLTLELVRRGDLTPQQALVAVTSGAAASMRIADKGRLELGLDGDLVLFDPNATRTVVAADLPSTSKWSCYDGMQLAGFPEVVVRRGTLLMDEGVILGLDGPDGDDPGDVVVAGGKPLRLEATRPKSLA